MQELTTPATLVDYETLEKSGSITAVLDRGELEAALTADDFELWFELAADDETLRLTLPLTSADVQELLRSASGKEVTLALDAAGVSDLFADPDVEAHGLRGALAIAVATAAFAAPAGLAATPQAVSSATSPQVSSQVSSAAASAQVSSAVSSQVSSQVVRSAVTSQVKAQVIKTQLKKSLVVKAGGVKILRGGLAQ